MNRIRMLRSMTAAVSVAVVMVAFATPAAAAPAPDPLWVATDDDPFGGYDTAEAVAVDPVTGNVYVNGTGSRANNSDDLATIGYTAAGGKVVEARLQRPLPRRPRRRQRHCGRPGDGTRIRDRFEPASRRQLRFRDGSLQPDRTAAVGGAVCRSRRRRRERQGDRGRLRQWQRLRDRHGGPARGTGDFVTVAYSRTGQKLWARGYDGPKHGTDTATEIAVDEQTGVVHVAGNSRLEQDGEIGENAYVTLAYSASGSRLWTVRQTNLPGVRNYLAGLGLTPAGATVILGRSEEAGERFEHQLIAYGTSGEELWTATEQGPRGKSDSALAVDPTTGNAYVLAINDQTLGRRRRSTASSSATTRRAPGCGGTRSPVPAVGPPIPSGLTSPSMPAAATSTPCRSTTTAACTSRPRRTAPVASRCGPPRTPRRTSPSTSLQTSLSTPRVATSTSSVGPEPAPKWTS